MYCAIDNIGRLLAMKRRHESQIDLNGRNRDDEHTKRKDSSIKSIGKIKREIRSVKRLLSRVEVRILTVMIPLCNQNVFITLNLALVVSQ